MTNEQLKLELDACTLRPQDASVEARRIAEQDAELSQWLKKRTLFDEQMADVHLQASIPAGLREQILRNSRTPKSRLPRWLITVVLSAAAAFAFSWLFLWPESGNLPAWQSDSIAAVAKIEYGLSRLDERAPTFDEVKQLLAATNSSKPESSLPSTLTSLRTYGCKRIQIGNRPASIICFKMASGNEAHLVVLDTADLESRSTQFSTSKNWNMATWSDGHQTFMLATTSDVAELKKLLSLS